MSDIPNVVQDSTPTVIPCRCCGETFTKRADEGVSQCYECYKATNMTPEERTLLEVKTLGI